MRRLRKKLATEGTLSSKQYTELRKLVGTQAEAAELLGVHPATVAKREQGKERYPIDREASVAMMAVAGVWPL